jgi:hypothetical protein
VPFLRIRGYLFGSYSDEPHHEPAHIHIKGKGGRAKFWLRPVRLASSTYTRPVTRDIELLVRRHEAVLCDLWRRRHGHR